MVETINLIPKEERVQQTKTKVVKLSTYLAIGLLVIVAGVGGYFFYKAQTIKGQVKQLEGSVATLRADINKLSDIEISARNLYTKSEVLSAIFDDRVYYSRLLKELEVSTPSGVLVKSFGLGKDTTISISGEANTYNDVQDFSNKLLDRQYFTEVSLNSVGLESRKDKVNFFIVVSYSEELLHD
ncbi:PilN domain-containing protein [Patescibacteria group bacterium]